MKMKRVKTATCERRTGPQKRGQGKAAIYPQNPEATRENEMKTDVMVEPPADALNHMHLGKVRLRYIQHNLKPSKRKTDVDMCTESAAAKFEYTLVKSIKKRRHKKQQQDRLFQTKGHQH